MAFGMEARGMGGSPVGPDGERSRVQRLRDSLDELPSSATNWFIVVVGVLVIGCTLMLVAAVRLLAFEPIQSTGVPVLLQAGFDAGADPFPDAAGDSFTTSTTSGAYVMTSTDPQGGAALRTAGLAGASSVLEMSATASSAVASADSTVLVGVACLAADGARGYALLSDGAGDYSLASVEGGELRQLAATQQSAPPAAAGARLALTCVQHTGGSTAGTRLAGSVDGVAVLGADDGGVFAFGQAGLVGMATRAGATATFDDVLVLVPPTT